MSHLRHQESFLRLIYSIIIIKRHKRDKTSHDGGYLAILYLCESLILIMHSKQFFRCNISAALLDLNYFRRFNTRLKPISHIMLHNFAVSLAILYRTLKIIVY